MADPDHVAIDMPTPISRDRPEACPVMRADIRYAFTKLGIQAGVSLTAIALSAAMLATKENAEGTYLPVISAIVGFWLPSPNFSVNRPQPTPDFSVARPQPPRAPRRA